MSGPYVHEVLAEAFLQEHVDTCFALLGDANMIWAASMAARGCRFVYVRDEHNAVSAAMSWARATNRIGLASVTCGPGLTQILTALPAAVRAGIPLVVFAGEAPLGAAWYNQAIDQAPFVTACGAAYHALHHVPRMPAQVRDAFIQAAEERRPVVLGVPFDLQHAPWPGEVRLPPPAFSILARSGPMPPSEADLARARAEIEAAERVVVLAGLGAVRSGAGPACRVLAEKAGGLLATTLPARGLFNDDPYCIGIAGGFSTDVGRECLSKSDLVIAVGARLASHTTDGGKLWPSARTLRIDTQPLTQVQGRVAADMHMRADAALGTQALADAMPSRDGWRDEGLARAIRERPADSAEFPAESGLHDPRTVVAALDAALPQSWEMVNSSGHCSYFFAQMQRPAEHFHTIREFGAIGNGLAYAIGVATARPERPVVLFDGDGSLMMHIQELETIRRHGLRILICVMNDGAYGSEIHKLRADGLPLDGAVFGRGDLGAVARGFGLDGRVMGDLAALPELVRAWGRQACGALWDFHVSDRVASPVVRRSHPHKAAAK